MVSILVVVDDGRRHGPAAVGHIVTGEFQSLLLWMTVVDQARSRTRARTHKQFQSLLLWMTVVDCQLSPASEAACHRFQSLLLWMTVVDPSTRWQSQDILAVFQSLLSWMTVVDKTVSTIRPVGDRRVSILVVVDDGRRLGRAGPLRDVLEFQSLLSWMTVVDAQSRRQNPQAQWVSILVVVDDGRRPQHRLRRHEPRCPGFNPCCCG